MKKLFLMIFFIFLKTDASEVSAYTNLSPADLHARLVRGDSLLLLDVREVSEYRNGHITEPSGQLPLTPANMPWNGSVLQTEYPRLPRNTDVVVYCGSGSRSAAASSFLDSKGFSRVYNMTGGFSTWTYGRRSDGFGDHTGAWVRTSDVRPVVIMCPSAADTSRIVLTPAALGGNDSCYVELHFASSSFPVPPGIPDSELHGLFRITVLDRFGLSRFAGDSLVLSDTASIRLFPGNLASGNNFSITNYGMDYYVPDKGWRSVSCDFDGRSFHRIETILRKWVNIKGFFSTAVAAPSQAADIDFRVFPNPFNDTLRIFSPPGAVVRIYDARGRFIRELRSDRWIPDKAEGSGLYFIQVRLADKTETKKIMYLK
jgi:rhodanese-related sulfurtransferase